MGTLSLTDRKKTLLEKTLVVNMYVTMKIYFYLCIFSY